MAHEEKAHACLPRHPSEGDVKANPILRATLFALAEMQHGPQARRWGLWHIPFRGFEVRP